MAINWELGRIDPNIATNTLAALQAGRQQRNQTLRENALRAYAQTGNLTPDLAATDAQTYIGLQANQRANDAAARTEDAATRARHQAAAGRWAAATLAVPADPVDPANPGAPPTYHNRQQYAVQLAQDNIGDWDQETQRTVLAAASNPNARFDDATLAGLAA